MNMNFEILWENASEDQRVAISDRFTKIGRKVENSPWIILPVGAPGSGKSTWVNQYLSQTHRTTVVVSTDNQIDEIARATGKTYAEVHASCDMKAMEQKMAGQLRVAVAERKDIIVDRTNMRIRPRNRWLGSVPRHFVRICVLLKTPVAVLEGRLSHRHKTEGKYVPRKVVNDMIDTYQPPEFGEFDFIHEVE